MPASSSSGEDTAYLYVATEQYSLIYRYYGLTANEANELDCLTFQALATDALALNLKETEEGREYLEKVHRLQQTAPDRKALREQFNQQKGE